MIRLAGGLMHTAMSQLQLSACAYQDVLKLARTSADLAETLQYRPKSLYG